MKQLLLCIVAAFAPLHTRDTAIAATTAIEQRVIDARKRITSCELEVHCTLRMQAGATPESVAGRNDEGRWHVWIVDGRFRRDVECLRGTSAGWNSITILTPEEFLEYSADDDSSTPRVVATAKRTGVEPRSEDRIQNDLRWLGIVIRPVSLHGAAAPTTILTNPARTESTVEEVALSGCACQLVRITMKKGQRVAYWISPGEQYAIRRAEISSSVGGHEYHSLVEVEGQFHEPSSIWFPTRCRYYREIDGQFDTEELANVRVVSLNDPIPERTFSLAGMDLPVGWSVIDSRRPGEPAHLTWNGDALVPYQPQGDELTLAATSARSSETAGSRRLVWFGLALVFAAVAAVLFWRLRAA